MSVRREGAYPMNTAWKTYEEVARYDFYRKLGGR
jgi:hypothetical protein